LKLNGEKGEIEAQKIIIGSGAKIESYIELGNAYLYNPNYSGSGGNIS
jgi:hypothetical protein